MSRPSFKTKKKSPKKNIKNPQVLPAAGEARPRKIHEVPRRVQDVHHGGSALRRDVQPAGGGGSAAEVRVERGGSGKEHRAEGLHRQDEGGTEAHILPVRSKVRFSFNMKL